MSKKEEINKILDSEEFKDIYDVEEEKKELAKDGWTLDEVMGFAGFVKKRVTEGINEYTIKR